MPLDYIPPAHVSHLLRAALDKKRAGQKAQETWLAKLNSRDAGTEREVHEYIDATFPGTIDHLENIWAFYGQRAVLLWRLPYLEGKGIQDALERHPNRLNSDGVAPIWVKMKPKATPESAAVRRLRVDGDELQAEAWITKKVHVEYEDQPSEFPRTEKVQVRINFAAGNKVPLGEGYASFRDARFALFALLDWLRGTTTPRNKSKEQEKILLPVSFNQTQIVALAGRLGWGCPTALVGMDPTGEVGELVMSGHKSGHELGELDANAAKVQLQLGAANAAHRYKLEYTHDDGFVERPQASFHFQGAQSRVQFHTRTSRLAMDKVIAEIRTELKL